MSFQRFNTTLSRLLTTTAFKVKWSCYNTNSQNPHFFSNFGNNRSCTSTCTTTHTSGYKHHVSPFKVLTNNFTAFFCCYLAYFRVSTCT
ncbi:Uncharacterised protein [Acinetobacter baumannii]|nr:Uncharacterised protein [Acinetobacter baumannii]